MDRSGVGGTVRPTLVLASLALVLGLVGMHGLAGGHHSDSGRSGAAAGAAAATLHAGHDMVEAGVGHTGDLALGGVPACDSGCPTKGVVTLCLAVLGALALVLLFSAARPDHRRHPLNRDGPASPRGLRLRPSLDPVSELCISRT